MKKIISLILVATLFSLSTVAQTTNMVNGGVVVVTPAPQTNNAAEPKMPYCGQGSGVPWGALGVVGVVVAAGSVVWYAFSLSEGCCAGPCRLTLYQDNLDHNYAPVAVFDVPRTCSKTNRIKCFTVYFNTLREHDDYVGHSWSVKQSAIP